MPPQNTTQTNTSGNGSPYTTTLPINPTQTNTPTTVNAGAINGFVPGNLPSPYQPPDLNSIMGGLQTQYNQYNAQSNGAMNDIQNLSTQLGQQSSDIINQQNAAGLPGMNSQLKDLQALQTNQLGQYLSKFNAQQQGGTGTVGGVSAQENYLQRQHAVDSLITSSSIQALQGNITTAQNQIDQAIKLKYDPIEQALKTKQFILEQSSTKAAAAQSKLLDIQLKKIEEDKSNEKEIMNFGILAAKNGAPSDLIGKITNAKTMAEAIRLGGAYAADPLDRSLKSAQLRKLQLENVKNDPAAQNAIVNSVINEKDPVKLISGFFKLNPKLKTNQDINNAAAVVSSVNEIAGTTPSGKIPATGFLGGGFLPEAFLGQSGVDLRSKIKTLNLKVQQWASGAALSKQQEKYVLAMLPESNDTDKTVQTKLNSLSNYMLSDIKGRAATQGGNFEYVPLDLWANPEQQSLPKIQTSISQAVAAGYQPAEVVQYVFENYPDKAALIQQARDYGYSDEEISNQLSLE